MRRRASPTAQIAISHGLARYLGATEGFDVDDFTVVHYGIEPGPEPPPPPDAPRLVAVGRLIPIKGFDVLLRAFATAREQAAGPDARDRRCRQLEAARLRAAAPDGVTFLGQVGDVHEVYERNAIVVVPSRGEGFGMVALEAAERGRAAIVTDVGGLPEIVEDGETGLVVPPEDAAALAAAIVALASDHERVRRFGEAARARALSPLLRRRRSRRRRGRLPPTARVARAGRRRAVAPMSGHAVVSCHVERPLDDRVWRRLRVAAATTARRVRRHAAAAAATRRVGRERELWLERARRVQALAPLGHHTHWGGPAQARPQGEVDAAAVVREEAAWFR